MSDIYDIIDMTLGQKVLLRAPSAPVIEPPVPPVEPPPNGIEVTPAKWSQSFLDSQKDGAVLLLHGGEYNTPFLRIQRKITVQNFKDEVPILTVNGRPNLLWAETDCVMRGLTFKSQSTGFDDSQGAALSETRTQGVAIGLVWYDQCTFIGTSKMATREQLLYISDLGKPIEEVRITGCTFDGQGSQGFGVHPYDGPTPKLVTVSDSTFSNLPRNAAVLNAANACLVKVDRSTFVNTVTYARGMYGPVDVSNSRLSGTPQGTVNDKGGNTR